MLETIAAIGFGLVGAANLVVLLFRNRLGLQHIPRWQLALATGLFASLAVMRVLSLSYA
ncbi:MAG: hypothetical protein NXH78_16490 [Hyphomonadaceae bacterium]|nr:hypothetical protein [Hyphomonadaceae bacterium]